MRIQPVKWLRLGEKGRLKSLAGRSSRASGPTSTNLFRFEKMESQWLGEEGGGVESDSSISLMVVWMTKIYRISYSWNSLLVNTEEYVLYPVILSELEISRAEGWSFFVRS